MMNEDIFYFEGDKQPMSDSLTLTGAEGANYIQVSSSAKPLLFDISWEVCRKVGGIYTVITSKAQITVSEWGDRYGLIGPYSEQASHEFEEIPPSTLSTDLIECLKRKHGIRVYFGRWLVKGYPRVFLIDINSSMDKLDYWRSKLMGSFSVNEDGETNEAIVFGNQVAIFFHEFVRLVENRPVVAHFHEWLTGVGLICLRQLNVKIAMIFTTHATLFGRYLAAGHVDVYNVINRVNPDEEAGRRGIYHRHWIETGAARGADIFTTVSEITNYEAQYALGRAAEVITPNGLLIEKFVALHEFQNLHRKNKERISEFVVGHFFGNLDFDIDKTLYMFTAGRQEYHNKGVDLFIESLARLNYLLKKNSRDITVVAFIIMPGKVSNYNIESIKGQSLLREIKNSCDKISKRIKNRLYNSLIAGEVPDPKVILGQEDMVILKRRVQSVHQTKSLPPIVTHNMESGTDEILENLRRCDLINKHEDRVKVIYHPEFLNLNSPIFPIEYDSFVRGCHLGVFPSYYEPWGYTPAECTVMGVPSISSNLTGFANYMASCGVDVEEHGVYIIDRRERSFDESKEQMVDIMWKFTQLSRRQRIELRNKTEKLSHLLDWKLLGRYYYKARRMALKKVYGVEIPMPSIFSIRRGYEGTGIDDGVVM
ncbi:glycogen [starch] synthase-like [Schistocerca gregaria]|uniref:glycogen [starch] synthase-like n=1 Tax=Schistocerca gregaria TaxID=7010 RepID=UPI00211EEBCB|nr:glycogen [starch] synthase-like [Schistocerca gregaria]